MNRLTGERDRELANNEMIARIPSLENSHTKSVTSSLLLLLCRLRARGLLLRRLLLLLRLVLLKPLPHALRELEKLLRAHVDALALAAVEALGVVAVDAALEAMLRDAVEHAHAVLHLHIVDHIEELRVHRLRLHLLLLRLAAAAQAAEDAAAGHAVLRV